MDWACCKVEQSNLDENQLFEVLKSKLEKEKSIPYNEIAQKAILVNKETLAQKLLTLEICPAKRVSVYLLMNQDKKGTLEVHFLINFF